jgi:hypothetical protein
LKWIPILLFSILAYSGLLLSCQKELSCEDCYDPGNKQPIAKAGADTIVLLPADSSILYGGNSYDPDGRIDAYRWRQISGPGTSNILNIAAPLSVVKGMAMGSYLFELTVTDNGALTSKDTVQVTMSAAGQPNRPPRAYAGPDQVVALSSNLVNLDGRGSTDPENNIVSYEWRKLSGPNSNSILSPNTSTTLLTNLLEGIYFFELRVVDAGGLYSTDTMQLTVNPQTSNPAAAVNAGPDIILTLPLDSVYLDGKWSGSQNAAFVWTKIDGPAGGSISTANMLHAGMAITTGLTPGLYSFSFSLPGIPGMADTMTVQVIDDPADRNTITFKNLKWRLADEYGLGILDLDIVAPAQPNLFSTWDRMIPSVSLLQVDALMPWVVLPATDPFSTFTFDFARPHIWVMRLPNDPGWVSRESSLKIKIL